MGANFNSATRPGTLTPGELRREFEGMQQEDRYENGHSYSGGWGQARGLSLPSQGQFPSKDAAIDWLEENAQKWEPALAVRAIDNREKLYGGKPNPDFNKEIWVLGAWCAS